MKSLKLFISILSIIFSTNGYTNSYNQTYDIKYNLNEIETSFYGSHYKDSTKNLYYSESIALRHGEECISAKLVITKKSELNDNKHQHLQSSPNFSFKTKTSREVTYVEFSLTPIYRENGQSYKIDQFRIDLQTSEKSSKTKSTLKATQTSPLNSGQWVKVKFDKTGIYKISGSDLADYGFENVQSVRLFGRSGSMAALGNETSIMGFPDEIPIRVFDGGDGRIDSDDYILFYGQSPHDIYYDYNNSEFTHQYNCYSNYSFVLITVNIGTPKLVGQADYSGLSVQQTFNYYYDVQLYENNDTNLVHSSREWVEFANNKTAVFAFPNLITSKDAFIKTKTLTTNATGAGYSIYINSATANTFPVGNGTSIRHTGRTTTKLTSSATQISLRNTQGSGLLWIDNILVTAPCYLSLRSGQLAFQNQESLNFDAVKYQFSTNNISIWDVTDFNNATALNVINGEVVTPSNMLRKLIAFDNTAYLSPEFDKKVDNQNLTSSATAEMIIITHPELYGQAKRLANFHVETDGISSLIVSQEQIFNAFSAGQPDITSIRNFIRYKYSVDNRLRYLLIMGDGSFDNSNLSDVSTLIGTYQSPGTGSLPFVSDDYYGLLDVGEGEIEGRLQGALDIGIGRIPVNNADQAEVVVSKILHYSTSASCRGKWRNNMAFLADDGDGNLHMSQSDSLTRLLKSYKEELLFDKIFADAFPKIASAGGSRYPEVNEKIERSIKKGMLVFNYTGHGNPVQFGGERYLTVAELNNWKNYDALPLVITASCEVSRYDDHSRRSIGEQMLLHEKGGAIGLMTTTRLVYANPNFKLNLRLFAHFYEKNEWGVQNTLGDIVRKAKVDLDNDFAQNKRNFSLLGDPAMRIAIPEMEIKTDSINGVQILESIDTSSALSVVRISGHIENSIGAPISNYNGIIYPTVLDKSRGIITLNNNEDGSFNYEEFSNPLFKGKATVKDGLFTFSFLVPKDISYKNGFGKISYYADNGAMDASGSYSKFAVGGTAGEVSDIDAPEIALYMNDTNFVFGGTTDAQPELLIKIEDASGVNISGNAVGHDLIATIDKDDAQTYILNDYYEADLDNYKRGTVRYPLSKLEEGKHSVKVKVWDAANNSSDDFLEFYVAESAETALKHVLNYPNPFTTSTDFYFEHNQAGQQLDILVQIFTVSGKLIKTIENPQFATGFRSQPIHWNGRDDYGDKIGRGVYFYKITVRSEDGGSAEVIEKLVLLK